MNTHKKHTRTIKAMHMVPQCTQPDCLFFMKHYNYYHSMQVVENVFERCFSVNGRIDSDLWGMIVARAKIDWVGHVFSQVKYVANYYNLTYEVSQNCIIFPMIAKIPARGELTGCKKHEI